MSYYLITDLHDDRNTLRDIVPWILVWVLGFGMIFAFGAVVGNQQIEREQMHAQCESAGGVPEYDACYIDGKAVTLP